MICQDDVQPLSILHSPHSVTKDTANKTHDMLATKYSAKVVNIGTPKLTKVKARQQESDEITTSMDIGTVKTTSADGIMMTSSVVTHRRDDNQLISTVKHSGMICQDDVQPL